MDRKRVLRWALGAILMVSLPVMAGDEVYRYRDQGGRLVLDDHIPREYVSGGYDVLSPDGRLIQRIAPASDHREEEIDQAALDAVLVKRYGHPGDIQRLKQRKIEEIDGDIHNQNVHIELLAQHIERHEERAADLERQGKEVSEELLAEIESYKADIERRRAAIATSEQLKADHARRYDSEYERLKFLMNL